MRFNTHIVFSVFLLLIFFKYFNLSIFLFVFGLFFCILPDIDSWKSFIGKKLWFISWFFNLFFGHRKFFHSFTFVIVGFLGLFFLNQTLALAFIIGYSSHLILDMLTYSGIYPFYPLKFRVKGFLKTGGFFDWLIFFVFLVADGFLVYYWFL